MPSQFQSSEREVITKLRAERAAYYSPVFLGAGTTLVSAAVFASAWFLGPTFGLEWRLSAAPTTLLSSVTTIVVPLAAIAHMTSFFALIHDRAQAREQWYGCTAGFALSLSLLAFTAISACTFVARRADETELAHKCSKGAILLGYGAWTSILANLAGSPTDFILIRLGKENSLTAVVDSVNEKTPLKAVAV